MDEAIISGYSVSLVLHPEVEMANGFFKLIDELMTVLKAGTDAVLKKLDDLVKAIKKWFDELVGPNRVIGANNFDDLATAYGTKLLKKGNAQLRLKLQRELVLIEKEVNFPHVVQKFETDFKKKKRKMPLDEYLVIRKQHFINLKKGKAAERIFAELNGGGKLLNGGGKPIGVKTSITWRYPVNVKDGICREIKSGKAGNTDKLRKQILKDIDLLYNKRSASIGKIEWHILDGIDENFLKFVKAQLGDPPLDLTIHIY